MSERFNGFVLVGPTAVGKSSVAHAVARAEGLPILSADSMLVYRGMDIGTAKPDATEREGLTYAGIDLADPSETFSVAEYLRRSLQQMTGWRGPCIVAGGTGLYVKCLLEGLGAVAQPDPVLRARADALFAEGGVKALQDALRDANPALLAELADPQNPRRLVRALEHAWQGKPRPEPVATVRHKLVGLRRDPEDLSARIVARVQAMFNGGLLDEADRLRSGDAALSPTAQKAIGYEEAWAVLDGRMTREAAVERTVIRTRQLAKRQFTWFRHQSDVEWVEIDAAATVESVAAAVKECWERHGPNALRI